MSENGGENRGFGITFDWRISFGTALLAIPVMFQVLDRVESRAQARADTNAAIQAIDRKVDENLSNVNAVIAEMKQNDKQRNDKTDAALKDLTEEMKKLSDAIFRHHAELQLPLDEATR